MEGKRIFEQLLILSGYQEISDWDIPIQQNQTMKQARDFVDCIFSPEIIEFRQDYIEFWSKTSSHTITNNNKKPQLERKREQGKHENISKAFKFKTNVKARLEYKRTKKRRGEIAKMFVNIWSVNVFIEFHMWARTRFPNLLCCIRNWKNEKRNYTPNSYVSYTMWEGKTGAISRNRSSCLLHRNKISYQCRLYYLFAFSGLSPISFIFFFHLFAEGVSFVRLLSMHCCCAMWSEKLIEICAKVSLNRIDSM